MDTYQLHENIDWRISRISSEYQKYQVNYRSALVPKRHHDFVPRLHDERRSSIRIFLVRIIIRNEMMNLTRDMKLWYRLLDGVLAIILFLPRIRTYVERQTIPSISTRLSRCGGSRVVRSILVRKPGRKIDKPDKARTP